MYVTCIKHILILISLIPVRGDFGISEPQARARGCHKVGMMRCKRVPQSRHDGILRFPSRQQEQEGAQSKPNIKTCIVCIWNSYLCWFGWYRWGRILRISVSPARAGGCAKPACKNSQKSALCALCTANWVASQFFRISYLRTFQPVPLPLSLPA